MLIGIWLNENWLNIPVYIIIHIYENPLRNTEIIRGILEV